MRPDIPAATPEIEQAFCSFLFAKTCPLSCRAKRACPSCDTLILPVSRSSRYNTLHLCSKGCVPKGYPLETLVLSECSHTSQFCLCAPPSKTAKKQTHICPSVRQICVLFLLLRLHHRQSAFAIFSGQIPNVNKHNRYSIMLIWG